MPRKTTKTALDGIPAAGVQSRKRKWAPRSRAGCMTCRIRRVRCDKGRPACERCLSTGRSCDYPFSQQEESSVIPRQPDPQLPGTDEERGHFHFFVSIIVPYLPSFFDFSFWDAGYLKACHTYPALFHASAAMAAVHRLMIAEQTQKKTSSNSEKKELSAFLLRQFNQSIRYMNMAIQSGGDDEGGAFILATCIVYTCLSAFQGRYLEAMVHVRSGLRILYACRLLPSSSSAHRAASPIPWETLCILLKRLDTQAHCLHPLPHDEETVAISQVEREFLMDGLDCPLESLVQVYSKIEVLCNSALRLMRRDCLQGNISADQRLFYSAVFDRWRKKLSTYVADIRVSVPVLAVISCEIRIAFISALLEHNPHEAETAWDKVTEHFEQVVRLASQMLENEENASRLYPKPAVSSNPSKNLSTSTLKKHVPASIAGSAPPMTLTAGVSEILYFVALHCLDPRIRRQAIHLLRDYPRREGILHTSLLSSIAKTILEQEADQSSSGQVYRMRDVVLLSVDEEKRLAEVSLETRQQCFKTSKIVLVHW